MAIRRETLTVSPTTGGAGVSTLNATTLHMVKGYIRAIHLDYLDSPPATTDVVVAGATAPAITILTATDLTTDAWFYPMHQAVNNANTAITGMGTPIAIDDYVKVTISQANDGDGVTATILYDDCMGM